MKSWEKLKDCIEVTLNSGKKTYISFEDEILLHDFPGWGISGSTSKYVSIARQIKTDYGSVKQQIYLHKAIMYLVNNKKFPVFQVDHKDRDRLNNRRSNLRYATSSQNLANTIRKKKSSGGYRGVYNIGRNLKKPYKVHLGTRSKTGDSTYIHIGFFDNPIEAAKAYDKAAKKLYGEFAILNFPEDK